jgi:hypothetical protein
MNKVAVLSAVLLTAVFAGALADTPAPAAAAPEVQIPFANHGGIYNWQVVDNRTILIQGQNRKWYKATLFSSCIDLPFSERLGFKSNADGSFDKFSSIEVRGQTCPLVSLVETTAPQKKTKAKKSDAPAASAAPAAPASPAQ